MATNDELDLKLNAVLANQLVIMEALEQLVWHNQELQRAGVRSVTWTQLRSHGSYTGKMLRRNTPANQLEEFKTARMDVGRVK